MWWHEKSWPMIEAVSKDTPVVVPIGACEQHGRHLPVFVDTIQVSAIAERVEKRLSDKVTVAPTLWLGSSHHHLDFPGTISLRPNLYSHETSMLLFLRPELVDPSQAKPSTPALDSSWYRSDQGGRVKVFRRFHRLTAAGSMGDPSAATAEKGKSMMDAVADDVVAFVEDFAKWPELPVLKE